MTRTKNRVIGVGWLAAVTILGAVVPVGAQEAIQVASAAKLSDKELLSFYFSDEQLVEVTTRAPQPLPRVAENVTIITAEQIAEMNAHNMSEVLTRISGLFMSFAHMDFGDRATFRTQGLFSRHGHTLVLVDGVSLNPATGNDPVFNVVPVDIVKRIEIILGPASSAWGSSMGGVINIITKDPVNSETPTGSVSGSYGEGRSQDLRANLAGKNYFLYADHQESDGHQHDRAFDSHSYYAKINLDMPKKVDVNLSLGHADPKNKWGDFAGWDMSVTDSVRQTFGAASVDVKLSQKLAMHAALKLFTQNYIQSTYDMAVQGWYGGTKNDFLYDYAWNERTVSSELRLAYVTDMQSMVVGAEIVRSRMDRSNNNGAVWQNYYAGWGMTPPADSLKADPVVSETWGVYLNDTLQFGKLALTPGLRYDHHSISQSFTSPSLGATYRLGSETIARFTIGRGFTYPALAVIAGGASMDSTIGNKDLRPEKVFSMQTGFDSTIGQILRYRLSLFRHALKDIWENDPLVRQVNSSGRAVRTGAGIETETASYHNISLLLGYTYVHERNIGMKDVDNIVPDSDYLQNDDMYNVKLAFNYNDGRYRAQLFGDYTWWDYNQTSSSMPDREFGGFIWNLALGAKVFQKDILAVELFATIHNLTNDAHYYTTEYHNPHRWSEAGVSIKF